MVGKVMFGNDFFDQSSKQCQRHKDHRVIKSKIFVFRTISMTRNGYYAVYSGKGLL